jgi:hypothetical protein
MSKLGTIRLNSFISKNFHKTDKEARLLIANGNVKVIFTSLIAAD